MMKNEKKNEGNMYILFLDFNKPLDCPPHLYKRNGKMVGDKDDEVGARSYRALYS